jgi:large subunit ribosomal protein L15
VTGKSKTKKFRGSRTCGGGTHKNRRGAGSRGGRGHAGGCKHHFVREMLQGRGYGNFGFKRPQKVTYSVRIVDVGVIDENAELRDDIYYIQLDVDKVLGSGTVTRKMIITANSFSQKAIRELESVGGRAILPD